jgi:hypothetical protein
MNNKKKISNFLNKDFKTIIHNSKYTEFLNDKINNQTDNKNLSKTIARIFIISNDNSIIRKIRRFDFPKELKSIVPLSTRNNSIRVSSSISSESTIVKS